MVIVIILDEELSWLVAALCGAVSGVHNEMSQMFI